MYERFSAKGRKVMFCAQQEAQLFNHESCGTEHVLLGLVKEGGGAAARILGNFGVDLKTIRLEVGRIVPSASDMVAMGRLPHTPRVSQLLEYAVEESRNFHHDHVGTEHLLLGLLRVQDGVAVKVLINLHLDPHEVRRAVVTLVGKGKAVQSLPSSPAATSTPPIHQTVRLGRPRYAPIAHRGGKVMQWADQAAARLKHDFIGTEHLLLWLVEEGGAAASILNTFGVDTESVRREAAKIGQIASTTDVPGRRPLTLRAEETVDFAHEEARRFNHNHLRPEHFLLALLRQREGAAAKMLANLNVQPDAIREEVLGLLGR